MGNNTDITVTSNGNGTGNSNGTGTSTATGNGTTVSSSDTPPAAAGDTAAHMNDVDSAGVRFLLGAVAAGAAVSVAAGVYANVHTPTGDTIVTFGFDAVLPMKAWFTTFAAVLVLAQVATAMWMWGRLPGVSRPAPAWAVHGHRWFGTAAFLFTLPVAYHCLWALGFQDTSARVLVHSLLGCAFYGVFTTKMLALRSDRVPRHTLPTVGGLLSVILVAIWWTSSWWFFTTIGFPT